MRNSLTMEVRSGKVSLLAHLLQPSCAASLSRKLTERVINGLVIIPPLITYNSVRGIPATMQVIVVRPGRYMDYGVIWDPKHVNSTLCLANGAVMIGNAEKDFATTTKTNACHLVRTIAVQGILIAPEAWTVVLIEGLITSIGSA